MAAVVEEAGRTFARAGRARSSAAHPDLGLADDTFRTLRAWHFQARLGALLAEHPDAFKQSLADNIRAGEGLTGADVARAYAQRTALAETMRLFFTDVRRAGAAGLPGAAVPGRPGVPRRDQRPADGDLPRLDAVGVLHHASPAAPRSRCRPAARPTGCRSGSRSSPRTAPDRRLLEIAAAYEAAGQVG